MTSKGRVNLVSTEGESFKVTYDVAVMSNLIKEQIEDISDVAQEIPLPNVKTNVLVKIVEFINYHHANPMKEIPKPIKWDLDFINTSYEMIFELILAANYLNIKSLLELACARMSGVMFGKTPEEIREMFGIKEQFTPEEE
ncbi:unnamed protein product [Aphanomyces euteiches]